MIYQIGDKFYLKVQGYYKEVDIKVNGSDLDITLNGNKIETTRVSDVKSFDMKINKDNLIQILNTKANESFKQRIFDGDTSFDEQHRKTRRRRM